MSSGQFTTPYKPRRPIFKPDRSAEPFKPWTAARCQRLLRPLLSRIASLRKDSTILLQTSSNDVLRQETNIGVNLSSPNKPWLKPRKKVRLTYSQRRSSQHGDTQSISAKDSKGLGTANYSRPNEKSRVPGELVAATPLLRRARGHVIPSPIAFRKPPIQEPEGPQARSKQDSRSSKGLAKQKEFNQRLAGLRTQASSDRRSDLEAVYKSLDALLKATRNNISIQRRGPLPLLDMCLKKVPQYIEELEVQERMDAAHNGTVSTLNDSDTSVGIYNYLESFAPTETLGWKHLRTVVRADGLKIVRQGILEGLFGDDFSELLIDLCLQNEALPEAEELIAALIERQYSQPRRQDSSMTELRCLSVLRVFSSKYGRTSFLLRQYSLLLLYGNLPQEWLATRDFENVWVLAARCLSKAEAADDAITFISYSVSLLCQQSLTTGSEKGALPNAQTLTSALTMLATMSWLGEIELFSTSVSEADITKIHFIGNRLRYILSSCMIDLEFSRTTKCNLSKDLLRMALFLSSSSARADDDSRFRLKNSIEQAWLQNTDQNSTGNSRAKHRLSDIASLVSSVARSCGRGMSLASHNCLDTIFVQLECLELDTKVLASMKAVAAFSLAQQTNNVKDFMYAERLASSQSSTAGGDARSRSLFTGYRWEETIGEWVTVSPVANRRRPQARIGQHGSTSRSEVDHGAEGVPTQPEVGTEGDADSVPDLGIEQERASSISQTPLVLRPGHINNRKRSHSCPGDGKLRTATEAAAPSTNRDFVSKSAKLADLSFDDELGSDKENGGHHMAKKPRRSLDRRVMWSSKPRSSLASQRSVSLLSQDLSDDELCM